MVAHPLLRGLERWSRLSHDCEFLANHAHLSGFALVEAAMEFLNLRSHPSRRCSGATDWSMPTTATGWKAWPRAEDMDGSLRLLAQGRETLALVPSRPPLVADQSWQRAA